MADDDVRRQLGNLRQLTTELTTMTTHPAFVQLIQEIDSAPPAERERLARRLSTLSELTRRGVPVPDTARITLRTFEDPTSERVVAERLTVLNPSRPSGEDQPGPAGPGTITDIDREEGPTVCASLGFFFCLSIGNITSGGGGGTDEEDPDPVGAGTGEDDEGTTG